MNYKFNIVKSERDERDYQNHQQSKLYLIKLNLYLDFNKEPKGFLFYTSFFNKLLKLYKHMYTSFKSFKNETNKYIHQRIRRW